MSANRVLQALQQELPLSAWRLVLARPLLALLPDGLMPRARVRIYRWLGLRIGSGTLLTGKIELLAGTDLRNLRIGARCFLNQSVFLDANAEIWIADNVSVGHHTRLITCDHHLGNHLGRCGPIQPRPIRVESGCWIAANVTILPGVTLGAGCVIAAGAVVTRDIPPNSLAAGVPARVIKTLAEYPPPPA